MAAVARVFTIRRAAEILGRDEDLLWDISDQLDPEDGKLWIYDVDGIETMAFSHTDDGAFHQGCVGWHVLSARSLVP